MKIKKILLVLLYFKRYSLFTGFFGCSGMRAHPKGFKKASIPDTTRIIFFIGLFIAFAFLVALFIAGFATIQDKNNKTQLNGASITLSLKEISNHNTANDCWLIINNKVYDVTSYVNSNPGGVSEIIKGCGKDATQLFSAKGGKDQPYSSTANSLLGNFYLGDLNQVLSSSQIENRTSSINNTQIPTKDGENEEDD